MILLKYTGITLTAISFMIFGMRKSSEIQISYNIKCEILSLLKHLEQGIKYGGKSIPNIISDFEPVLLLPSKCKDIKIYLSEILKNPHIDDKDKEILSSFFCNLGRSAYCEKELSNCRECIAHFEEAVKNSAKSTEAKSSLYTRLGIIASALSVIILI